MQRPARRRAARRRAVASLFNSIYERERASFPGALPLALDPPLGGTPCSQVLNLFENGSKMVRK